MGESFFDTFMSQFVMSSAVEPFFKLSRGYQGAVDRLAQQGIKTNKWAYGIKNQMMGSLGFLDNPWQDPESSKLMTKHGIDPKRQMSFLGKDSFRTAMREQAEYKGVRLFGQRQMPSWKDAGNFFGKAAPGTAGAAKGAGMLAPGAKTMLKGAAGGLVGAGMGLLFVGSAAKEAYQERGIAGAAGAVVKESLSWGLTSIGHNAMRSIIGGVSGTTFVVGAVGVAAAAGAAYGGYKALEAGQQYTRSRRRLDMGAPVVDQYGTMATMRQRSLMAMQKSSINGRYALGNEASILHNNLRR